jgi:regulatory protein
MESSYEALNPADIRRKGMDLLARREHGVEELRRKLASRFGNCEVTLDVIDGELARLVDEGLLSDDRFAAATVRQLIARGLGPRRLDEELRSKGVMAGWRDCADSEELAIDWGVQARTVFEKKFGDQPLPEDPASARKEWARRARFMQYRGFDTVDFMPLISG